MPIQLQLDADLYRELTDAGADYVAGVRARNVSKQVLALCTQSLAVQIQGLRQSRANGRVLDRLEKFFTEAASLEIVPLFYGGCSMASFILSEEDRGKAFKVVPKSAAGNAARIDGAPVWSTSDPSILTITPSADGLTCVVDPAGPLGAAQVSVSCDADLGAGVRTITATQDFEVQAAEAVTVGIEPV